MFPHFGPFGFQLVKKAKHPNHAPAPNTVSTIERTGIANTRTGHHKPAVTVPGHKPLNTSVDLATFTYAFATVASYVPPFQHVTQTTLGNAPTAKAVAPSGVSAPEPTATSAAAKASQSASSNIIASSTETKSNSASKTGFFHGTTEYAIIAGAGAVGVIIFGLLIWWGCKRSKAKKNGDHAWKKLHQGMTSPPSTPDRIVRNDGLMNEKNRDDWIELNDEKRGLDHYSPVRIRVDDPVMTATREDAGRGTARFNEAWDVSQSMNHLSTAPSTTSLPANHIIGFSDYPHEQPLPPQALGKWNPGTPARATNSTGVGPNSSSNLSVYTADEKGYRHSTQVGNQRLENRLMMAAGPTANHGRPDTVIDYSDAYDGELDDIVEEQWDDVALPNQHGLVPSAGAQAMPPRGGPPPVTRHRLPNEITQGQNRVDSRPLRDLEETFASLGDRTNSIRSQQSVPPIAPAAANNKPYIQAHQHPTPPQQSLMPMTAEQRLISEMGLPSPALSSRSAEDPFNRAAVIPKIIEPERQIEALSQMTMAKDTHYRSATMSIYGCYDEVSGPAESRGPPLNNSRIPRHIGEEPPTRSLM